MVGIVEVKSDVYSLWVYGGSLYYSLHTCEYRVFFFEIPQIQSFKDWPYKKNWFLGPVFSVQCFSQYIPPRPYLVKLPQLSRTSKGT